MFFWEGMYRDVTEFCTNCESCATNTRPYRSFPSSRLLFRVSMDILGPLPTTYKGNKYILSFQDVFSKYPEATCSPDQKAETVAKASITEVVSRHGAPEQNEFHVATYEGGMFATAVKLNVVIRLLPVCYSIMWTTTNVTGLAGFHASSLHTDTTQHNSIIRKSSCSGYSVCFEVVKKTALQVNKETVEIQFNKSAISVEFAVGDKRFYKE
ncbi:hypothetical protein PR048_020009 [Dryococelus australis]|uniref:Integrase zinc-binding domain-containing protein n=1 Tax=Dryococelus australis TaxID=614101 RepID=A0ABQ9H543_9NEOP|nr:hypothetical protein PR048_020009 [Dryococelus australis]